MGVSFKRRFMGGASGITIALLLAGPAIAQDAVTDDTVVEGDSTELGMIVVTGEKVARSIQRTASSVAVMNAEGLLKKEGAATVSDVIKDVPNVVYDSTVGAPIIRGQDTQGPNYGSTAFFGGTIPRATINQDGHYMGFYEYVYGGASIWDVDSIEVFRGPQTTSQGANAIAGAIVVDTKDPTFTPEGAYQAELGNYGRKRASLALSGPIIDDELAGRIAIDYWGRDTFIDYLNAYKQGDTDQDFRSFNGRAKLLWEPSELSGFSANLTYSHSYNNRPTFETASAPYDDLDNITTSMPSWEATADTGVLDLTHEMENGLTLFNQTQYSSIQVDRYTYPDTSGTASVDQQNLSNDLRATFGDSESIISGVAGLYVSHTTSDDYLYLVARGTDYTSDFDDEKDSIGLYTEATYRFTDKWSLTGGLRFQQDHIQRSGTSGYATSALDYDETFQAWLPKVVLAYDITDDFTVGAMISRGYNPGGVNLAYASGSYITFEEETVWNYELFGRAELLDNRLGVNWNIFYADYKDSQRLIPDYLGTTQYGAYVVNADEATAYGLELGMDYQVLDNLTLRASAGLMKTEIGEFADAMGNSYEGNEFSRAPGYMFSAGLDWDILPELRLSADVRHTDGYFSDDENTAAYAVGEYTVANARITYAPTETAQFYAFVNNIFDERAPTYLYSDRAIGGTVANMLEPRTFGVGIKGTF